MNIELARNELDLRIWEEELEPLLPERIFDIHTHVFKWEFDLNPPSDAPFFVEARRRFPTVGREALAAADAVLLPGRRVRRLAFPFPFTPRCDFDGSNVWAAQQAAEQGDRIRRSPRVDARASEYDPRCGRCGGPEKNGFLGFKPYRFYSTTGDPVECRITDFLPEGQLEVADARGLLVMLHLSKRRGIANSENLADLRRLSERFPNIKWILAHCARSYYPAPIRKAAAVLRDLKTAWYDVSSVCDSDAISTLIDVVGIDRVMYGSDDLPVGAMRGKYVTFGRGWAFLGEYNHSLDLGHCDGRMTFVRYEQLRAMLRAIGTDAQDLARVFHDNASELIERTG